MPAPDPYSIQAARRQHLGAADKIMQRIIRCAGAGRVQLANGQPAGPVARQILADAAELLAELGKLAEADRFAAWMRKPAA